MSEQNKKETELKTEAIALTAEQLALTAEQLATYGNDIVNAIGHGKEALWELCGALARAYEAKAYEAEGFDKFEDYGAKYGVERASAYNYAKVGIAYILHPTEGQKKVLDRVGKNPTTLTLLAHKSDEEAAEILDTAEEKGGITQKSVRDAIANRKQKKADVLPTYEFFTDIRMPSLFKCSLPDFEGKYENCEIVKLPGSFKITVNETPYEVRRMMVESLDGDIRFNPTVLYYIKVTTKTTEAPKAGQNTTYKTFDEMAAAHPEWSPEKLERMRELYDEMWG